MKGEKKSRVMLSIILWLLSLIILIPIFMVIINSFKDRNSAALMNLQLPQTWHIIQNYSQMIQEGDVIRAFMNSSMITVICVASIILLSAPMSFILQRRVTWFSKTINMVVIFGLVLPVQMIPTFFLCNTLKLSHVVSAILVLIITNLSFTVFLYTGYMKSIPREIDESAWLDGAGNLTLFFKIIFPLLLPVTVTAIIVSFMAVWNDFGISIYFLNSSQNFTLPLTIYNFYGNHGNDWQLVFSNVVITSLPVAIVYFVLQKYIISGMTTGAVKG